MIWRQLAHLIMLLWFSGSCGFRFLKKMSVLTKEWDDRICFITDQSQASNLTWCSYFLQENEPVTWNKIDLLMDHREENLSKITRADERVISFIREFCQLIQYSRSMILRVIGIIDTNAYIIGENKNKNVDIQVGVTKKTVSNLLIAQLHPLMRSHWFIQEPSLLSGSFSNLFHHKSFMPGKHNLLCHGQLQLRLSSCGWYQTGRWNYNKLLVSSVSFLWQYLQSKWITRLLAL